MKVGQHQIDNKWIIPCCLLLLKIFNAHIDVEFCNFLKSTMYICKYVTKSSDTALFDVQRERSRDEISVYFSDHYISNNEEFWRILGFSLYQKYPAVDQFALYFENGQIVYFTEHMALQLAENILECTLIAFFKLCRDDDVAKTLLFSASAIVLRLD